MASSEHAANHPDDGKYWEKNFRPDHYIVNAVLQFRECMANGRPIPQFLWKQVAPVMGFDAEKQPDKLKPRTPFSQDDLKKLNERIAALENLAKEQGAIKEPAPRMRQPAAVPGAE